MRWEGHFRLGRELIDSRSRAVSCSLTGPFKVNGVPIRRVNQAYVIATSTKIDVAGVKVDDKINDAYFNREKVAGAKPEASFFADPKNKAAHPEAKVADQKALDKAVIEAVKKAGPNNGEVPRCVVQPYQRPEASRHALLSEAIRQ
ncbi:hypothetical protein L7F22_044861 [Adiantum nelumboides]|nr:hypothetical protein [Adiantum nelumboides]